MEKQVNVLVVGEGGREFAVAKNYKKVPVLSKFIVPQAMWGCRL